MRQRRFPAAFIRGGTSKAIVFHARDLPVERAQWDELFISAIGSPDPYVRQLNGMGGGVSSLSKVCVVGPPSRSDADIDYTFAQVQIREAKVSYDLNCGNMSSAMGPFAVDEGLIKVSGPEALVRIHNTNTKKIIHARFPMDDGMAAVDGDLEIPGVYGTGAPVRLEFREPGGAGTGMLLPTGNVVDTLDIRGIGKIKVSMVDAANACVFFSAADIGLKGTEMPDEIDSSPDTLKKLDAIRVAASLAMSLAPDVDAAKGKSVPLVGFVSSPQDGKLLTGGALKGDSVDLTARMMSNGQPHRALPLTAALCIAVASRIVGTLVHAAARKTDDPEQPLRIAMPSGVLTVAASVYRRDGQWHAEQGALLRTQRRLFDGHVYVRDPRGNSRV